MTSTATTSCSHSTKRSMASCTSDAFWLRCSAAITLGWLRYLFTCGRAPEGAVAHTPPLCCMHAPMRRDTIYAITHSWVASLRPSPCTRHVPFRS